MPRSSKGSAVKTKPKPKPKPEIPATYVPKQGVFEFVVLTFNGLLPGQEGYERDKDRMMIGFRYGGKTVPSWLPKDDSVSDITAYDFLTDPKTGLRAGYKDPPSGSATTYLKHGISDYSDLPPLHVWKKGAWLSELLVFPDFDLNELPTWVATKARKALSNPASEGKIHPDIYGYYVTSGEGTQGNNIYRVFELPQEACGRKDPHHPLMWPEYLRKPDMGTGTAWKTESWREPKPAVVSKPAIASAPATKSFAPPAGVRMRCPGCGHWYTYQDLITHSAICGDVEKQDWAIMCHGDCGCRTLDEAATPKPGFPRPKPAKKEEEKDAGEGPGAD